MTERRYDLVSGEWRTVTTHRQDRTFLPAADACPLCPARPGEWSEPGDHAFRIATFDNLFPSLSADPPTPAIEGSALLAVAPARGTTEVVLWSDQHDVTLAQLPVPHLHRLLDVWAERYDELGRRPEVAYVLTFENKGEVIGVTLEHPHGQIYGYPDIPPRVERLLGVARTHLEATGACVACDAAGEEEAARERIVVEDRSTIAFVPFAARFPYEVRVQPKRHATSLLDMTDPERASFAGVLHTVLTALDGLFGFSLPYVLALHQAPTDGRHWLDVSHLQVEITPVHRSAAKLKYLAGSELAAGAFINDVAPETAAAALRAALG